MNEMKDSKEANETGETVTVYVGFDGEMRPVRFRGVEVGKVTNRSHEGPNQNRFHKWVLYRLPSGRYRVLDEYVTCWQGESGVSRLSDPLTGREVADSFPRVAFELLCEEETVIDLDDGDHGVGPDDG